MSLSTQKKQIIRFAGLQTGGHILGMILSIPVSFLTAAILGPALLGGLRTVGLVKRYATYANLGLIKGYRKEYTEAHSAANAADMEEIDAVGFTVIALSALASILIVILIYAVGIDVGGVFTLTTALLVMAVLLAERQHAFLSARAQGRGHFDLIGFSTVLLKTVGPLYILVGLMAFGVDGVVLAWLLIPLTGVSVLWHYQRDFRPRLRWRWKRIRSLVSVGGLQYLDGTFTSLIVAMGLTLAALHLEADAVGIYAYAEGALSLSTTLPLSLQTAVFKNMMNVWARRTTSSYRQLHAFFTAPLTLFIMITTLLAGGLYLGYSYVIPLLLPRFTGSLPVMSLLLFGQSVYAAQGFVTQYFITTDQIGRSATLSGIWAGVTFLVVSFGLTVNASPQGLALSMALCLLGYAVLFLSIALRQTQGRGRALWNILRYLLASVLLAGVAFLLGNTSLFGIGTGDLAARLLAGGLDLLLDLILWTATVLLGYSVLFADQGITNEIRQILAYGWSPIARVLASRKTRQP